MITKSDVANQILAGIGTERMTLDNAVAKAQATKQIKNKDASRAWKNIFAKAGIIVRDETGTYVTPKTPSTAAPAAATTVVAETTTNTV